MDMFFDSLPFPEKRRRHFHRFMHDVHTELKGLQNRESPLEAVAERMAGDTRVLCFDEFFVTDIADAMILGGLFEGLFKRGVTLVATSNIPPRDLYKDGLQRQRFLPAIDLIERHVEVLNVDGSTDYRLRQLTQAGTYLLSSAADTPKRLEALFAELAHHGASTGGTIEIEGRSIPVVRQSSSAVWFDFESICGGPRSQDDYIEIAREYQSVIVSDVPILEPVRENQARRFIALVDELYDRNVNLIVSAAASPVDLYRGDRLKFPFERRSVASSKCRARTISLASIVRRSRQTRYLCVLVSDGGATHAKAKTGQQRPRSLGSRARLYGHEHVRTVPRATNRR